ncbi:MAG: hypothetical protein EPO11_00120 [Gammaproteobacteria bacterium]|nr:MAG: hypothetical protein EPO11_00120 [Gammaproteobacteria bacterium]
MTKQVKDTQIELHRIAWKLQDSLLEGQDILQEKLDQLLSLNNPSEENHQKINLLNSVLGNENNPKPNTYRGLLKDIPRICINAEVRSIEIKKIYSIFNSLNNNIITSLKAYDNEKKFLNKFTEWVSNTAKKILRFKTSSLSTTGVLRSVAENRNSLFQRKKKEINIILFPNEKNSKKIGRP